MVTKPYNITHVFQKCDELSAKATQNRRQNNCHLWTNDTIYQTIYTSDKKQWLTPW